MTFKLMNFELCGKLFEGVTLEVGLVIVIFWKNLYWLLG